jgi:hypothetical protein
MYDFQEPHLVHGVWNAKMPANRNEMPLRL